jgi:hypothetical protein
LGSPERRWANYDGGPWRTPISFDHGYVLVWDDPVNEALAHAGTIALYAPDGHKLYTTSVTGPGGTQAWVVSGAIDVDGTVAAVYYDRANPQTRGIALIDRNGKSDFCRRSLLLKRPKPIPVFLHFTLGQPWAWFRLSF